jgi:hypothetical protein
MAEERQTLGPEALAALLVKLDEVMVEAERLRREVSRQLAEQRADQQQRVTQPPPRRRRAGPRR